MKSPWIVLLEGLTLVALMIALCAFGVGIDVGGLELEQDRLTFGMLVIVTATWSIYWLAARRWSNALPSLDPRSATVGPLVEFLEQQVRSHRLDVSGTARLRAGASEAVAEELQSRPAPLGPPYWLATGQGVLVSLGLLGTFLGLSLGLLQAVPKLQGDPEAMQVGMAALLGGAKLAFVKSLAGVLCAMVWGLRYRQLEEARDRMVGVCKDWLDERYPPVSTEELMARMLAEQAASGALLVQRVERLEQALVGAQREVLRAIGSTETQIGQVVNGLSYVGTTVKQSGAAVVAEVGQVATGLSLVGGAVKQSGAAVVAEVGLVRQAVTHEEGAIVSALQTLSDDEREKLTELIEAVQQSVEEILGKLGPNLGEVLVKLLGPQFEKLSEALKQLGEASGETLEGAVERGAGEAVTRLSGSLQAVADLLQKLPDQLGARIREAEGDVQKSTKRVAEEFETAGKAVAEGMKVASADMEGAHKRLNDSILEVRVLTEDLAGFGQQIQASLSAARESAAALDGHAKGLHDGVVKVTRPFSEVASRLEAVPGALNLVTEAMKAEQKALVGVGAELKGQAEAIRGQHEALRARIAEYQQLQAALSAQWGTQLEGVLKANQKVKDAWTTAIDAAQRGIESNAQQIAEYARRVELSVQVPTHLRNLDSAIQDLVGVLDDLKKTLAVRR